jgi:hypothetical protein
VGTIPASENEFPSVLFAEGAAPTTPATGLVIAYAKSDGLLYWKDDAGTEYPVSQATDLAAHLADTGDAHDASAISIVDAGTLYTATDVEAALAEVMTAVGAGGIPVTIIDAAGDLIVGTAADTAARLAIGATDGMALRRASGALAWNLPPGHEFDYVEKTSSTSITATTEGTADTVVTGSAVTYDGSTVVLIEFFSPSVRPATDAVADRAVTVTLYDGSSSIGIWGQTITPSQNDDNKPFYLARRLTPSAAAHTYSVRAYVSGGTGTVSGGAGGAAAAMPAFIRITKV